MSMMMRRSMMVPKAPGGLPAEYLAVQYIQAVPRAYINSGYVPTVAPRIETRIQIMDNSDNDLFGFENNTFPSFIVDATNYGGIFYNRWGQTPSTQFTPSQLKAPTDCVFGKTTIIGSNEYIDAFGDVDWSSNVQVVYIGRGRNVLSDVRIYSCKLYDGTALVRDLIPCIRISDSRPGMYDLVGRQFYVNQGTGEFIAGWYLLPEADGRIEKAMIPVKQGMHIRMDWVIDHTKDRMNDTVLSILNQQKAFTNNNNTDPNAVGDYPIISQAIHSEIFNGTYFEFDATQDLNLFVGYWQDSETNDRRVYGTYINIQIS